MSPLDPRTANVGFQYVEVFPGSGCIGRSYYWYDPAGRLPAIDAHEFREMHPEIDDDGWQRLFYEAFDRGETGFEERCVAEGHSPLAIGRLFGPRPPQQSKRHG